MEGKNMINCLLTYIVKRDANIVIGNIYIVKGNTVKHRYLKLDSNV